MSSRQKSKRESCSLVYSLFVLVTWWYRTWSLSCRHMLIIRIGYLMMVRVWMQTKLESFFLYSRLHFQRKCSRRTDSVQRDPILVGLWSKLKWRRYFNDIDLVSVYCLKMCTHTICVLWKYCTLSQTGDRLRRLIKRLLALAHGQHTSHPSVS